jgi:hypothetical protein
MEGHPMSLARENNLNLKCYLALAVASLALVAACLPLVVDFHAAKQPAPNQPAPVLSQTEKDRLHAELQQLKTLYMRQKAQLMEQEARLVELSRALHERAPLLAGPAAVPRAESHPE